jgi:hypothetical protein
MWEMKSSGSGVWTFPKCIVPSDNSEKPFDTSPDFKESHPCYGIASGPSLGDYHGAQFLPFHGEISNHEKQEISTMQSVHFSLLPRGPRVIWGLASVTCVCRSKNTSTLVFCFLSNGNIK